MWREREYLTCFSPRHRCVKYPVILQVQVDHCHFLDLFSSFTSSHQSQQGFEIVSLLNIRTVINIISHYTAPHLTSLFPWILVETKLCGMWTRLGIWVFITNTHYYRNRTFMEIVFAVRSFPHIGPWAPMLSFHWLPSPQSALPRNR